MVDAGSAQEVMGNHELNAIAWFLPDPDQPDDHLRSHRSPQYGDKNYRQHQVFLDAVVGTPLHKTIIEWFLTLPLWLDLPEVRVVHACWHRRYMDYLAPHLTADQGLNEDLMVPASREPADAEEKDNPDPSIFKAVEALLKCLETPPPTVAHLQGQRRSHAGSGAGPVVG